MAGTATTWLAVNIVTGCISILRNEVLDMPVIYRCYFRQLPMLAIYSTILSILVYSAAAHAGISWPAQTQSVKAQAIAAQAVQTQSMPVQSGSNAVILMYHNVSDDTHPSTSVTPARFKQHLQYLVDNEYTVWPLFKTLVYLATGKSLPAKTVVLTFDDAYRSVYDEAFPLLKEKGWPFTVFVTTQYITEGYNNFMSWEQLREIQQFAGEVGNHSFSHPHMVRKRHDESGAQWTERITHEIVEAQNVLRQQLGRPVWAVAYPYGEYSKEVKDILWHLGYFGLGQHSGVVSHDSDFHAIPRFPMAAEFDGLADFAMKVAAKNLPVTVISPADGVISKDVDIPVLTMKLKSGDYNKAALSCYASGQGRIQLYWLDEDRDMVSVSANKTISPGRTKYNCTAPSKTEKNVYYWFSFLWMKPKADGSWYKE